MGSNATQSNLATSMAADGTTVTVPNVIANACRQGTTLMGPVNPMRPTTLISISKATWRVFTAIGMITPCLLATPLTLYSIGNPTAKEQLYVELINRARANPTAEGIWLNSLNDAANHPNIFAAYDQFNVNLSLMQAEFVTGSGTGKPTLNVAPPLAPNSKLAAAAQQQAQNQIDLDFQGHGTNNNLSQGNAGNRITAQGYTYTAWSENTYTSSYNVLFGHAGYQVDWGGTDGTGMQGPPRGHRSSIHSSNYREIGISNLTSAETTIPPTNTIAIGPEICTQVFARESANTPFITGVAYYDLNGNNFYDTGEGIGGITVNVTGSSYYAVTSTSGGYAVPVSGNGNYDVSFTPANASATVSTETITGMNNLKKDFILTYTAPDISGASTVSLNDSASYDIDLVPGAASYTWRWGEVDSTPTTEDADQGPAGYTTATTGSYAPVQSTTRVSGNAFRLADQTFADQTLTLERTFTASATSTVHFKSRLTWQTNGQHAKVQVSEDNGATWIDTDFDQAGPQGPGENTFVDRSANLSGSAGKAIKIRFILNYQSGGIYGDIGATPHGWYIDDITFTGLEEVLTPNEELVSSGNSFLFTPPATGTYRLSARANLAGGALPFGNSIDVVVTNSDFSTWLTNHPAATGGNSGNPDTDPYINLLEYAFGLDPSTADALPLPTVNATNITMSANRPTYNHSDLTYQIERSSTLEEASWTVVKTFGAVEPLEYTFSLSPGSHYFYRWKITLTP